jgi:hypothetical protein
VEIDESLIASVGDVDDRRVTGELRLIAAVLERSLEDARRGYRDALPWISSNEVASEGWSYLTICDQRGQEPTRLRSTLTGSMEANRHPGRPRHDGSADARPEAA